MKQGYQPEASDEKPAVPTTGSAIAHKPANGMDMDIARAAAEQANNLFGKWMPERWLMLFVDSYNDIEACKSAPTVEPAKTAEVEPHMREHGWWEGYKG